LYSASVIIIVYHVEKEKEKGKVKTPSKFAIHGGEL
jgi:hypothetical protein